MNWDKKTVYSIACTGNALRNTKGDVEIYSLPIEEGGETPGVIEDDCNCRESNPLSCFGGIDDCMKIECYNISYGCGWLLLQSCNGKCGI